MVEDRPGLQLRDYLAIVRRRKWVLLFVIVAVCGTAVGASTLQTPVYEARTRLLLERTRASAGADFDRIDAPSVETEIQIVGSQAVHAEAERQFGITATISAVAVGSTAVIEVIAESTDPAQAAKIADAYAESYIAVRRQAAITGLLSTGELLQRNLADVEERLADAQAKGADLQKPAPEVQSMLNQKELIEQKLDELEVVREFPDGGAQIIGVAAVPTSPVRPTPLRNGMLGALVGLIFGLALVFLREHLDDSVTGEEDLHRAASDVRLVGTIPAIPAWRNRSEPFLVSLREPSSPPAEAYRSVRTSIRFMGLDNPLRSILVTSAGPGEGKTTTVANLAVALAGAGQKVLVVSCDLRKPRIHEFFRLSNSTGFTSVLLREVTLVDALQTVPKLPRIQVLASGPIPPNPSELLSSNRARGMLVELQELCDVVLIDAPPVLPVTDAVLLSHVVDGTLLVASAGMTGRRPYAKATQSLRQVGGRLVGVVLNGVGPDEDYGEYGSYALVPPPQKQKKKGPGPGHRPAPVATEKVVGDVDQTKA